MSQASVLLVPTLTLRKLPVSMRAMNNRRRFLQQSAATVVSVFGLPAFAQQLRPEGGNISFGLVTYMWGAEWDIPTIIKNLTELGIKGVELRVEHAHKVAPTLSPKERSEVQRQFSDGGIEIIGMGTNAQFDSPDKATLMTNLDIAKQHIKLSHDIGGSGVKVKPNNFHEKDGIAKEKTLEQIGKSLAELGDFSLGFGQEIRLEVHGDVTNLADVRKIMEIANADNVRVCWNSNPADIAGEGIEKNFAQIKDYLGRTVHVHELNHPQYPYDKLMKLLVNADYDGWLLCEASSKVDDKVKALGEQQELFKKLLSEARKA